MLLLALIMILQNVLILARKRWRKSKILPLLEQESSGPFATTAVGERGFVVPKVSPTPHIPFPSSPCHSPTTLPPCLLPPAYRSSFSSCQVVYHPSAPSVPARPPVEARKFVQAKQSREILSAFHLVEVSRGALGPRGLRLGVLKPSCLQELDSDIKIIGEPKQEKKKTNKQKSAETQTETSDEKEKNLPRPEWLGKKNTSIKLPDALLPPYHHHR